MQNELNLLILSYSNNRFLIGFGCLFFGFVSVSKLAYPMRLIVLIRFKYFGHFFPQV